MDKYPILPHIGYGLIEGSGFYFTLPFKAISLNEHKRMHFGKVKKFRGQYKSILDVIMLACVNRQFLGQFTEDGVTLWNKSMFDGQVELEWILTFLTTNRRDPSNYTQKILLDAITDVKMLSGDDDRYVKSDKTFFGGKGYDSITCVMRGKVRKQMMLKAVPVVEYTQLLESLELLAN